MKYTKKMQRKDAISSLQARVRATEAKLLRLKEEQVSLLKDITIMVAETGYELQVELSALLQKGGKKW